MDRTSESEDRVETECDGNAPDYCKAYVPVVDL